jgi:hypothetical protein
MRSVVCILLLLPCLCIHAVAQTQNDIPEAERDTTATESIVDGVEAGPVSAGKSPLGAVIRSAILPGFGQFYNEAYWKVPIVLGVTGFLVYGIVTEQQRFLDYRDQYAASITGEAPSGNLRLKQFREFYRDRRDTYAWWLLVAYLFQIADAFVDAHLFSFDVSGVDELSLLPMQNGLGVRLRF